MLFPNVKKLDLNAPLKRMLANQCLNNENRTVLPTSKQILPFSVNKLLAILKFFYCGMLVDFQIEVG